MTSFDNELFRDLFSDFNNNGKRSILFQYFQQEHEQNLMIMLKKSLYEEECSIKSTITFKDIRNKMDEDIKYNRIKKSIDMDYPDINKKEFIKLVIEKINNQSDSNTKKRKSNDEKAIIKLPCDYYDYIKNYKSKELDKKQYNEQTTKFIDELKFAVNNLKKTSKSNKNKVLQSISKLDTESKMNSLYNTMKEVLDLYIIEECNQFVYDSGYSIKNNGEIIEYSVARVKTIKSSLLNFYFKNKNLALSQIQGSRLDGNNKSMQVDDDTKDKIDELYKFTCANNLTTAVIPIFLDKDSGSGLYILGSVYLQSWYDMEGDLGEKVDDIIGEKACCYAIVKFFNLDFMEQDIYYWSPYSIIDPVNIKENEYNVLNPKEIIFNDLNLAIDTYQGQLNVSSTTILYDYFKQANFLKRIENGLEIAPEYAKYFSFDGYNDDDLEIFINEAKVESEEIRILGKEEYEKKKLEKLDNFNK